MVVSELIQHLSKFKPDVPVLAIWDGYAWPVRIPEEQPYSPIMGHVDKTGIDSDVPIKGVVYLDCSEG